MISAPLGNSGTHVETVESGGQSRTEGNSRTSKSDNGGSSATVQVSAQQKDAKGNVSNHESLMKVSTEGTDAGSVGFTQDDHNVAVTGSNVTREWTINGQDVAVSGSNNTLTFRGSTHGLSVTGSGNRVTVDNPAQIDVSGQENSIVYVGATPTITIAGSKNAVTSK